MMVMCCFTTIERDRITISVLFICHFLGAMNKDITLS